MILFSLTAIVYTVGRFNVIILTRVSAGSLTPLSLVGYHRLLVLAPHCDDETLSSAGLMLAAQRAGIQVRVVIATNGDGSRSTAIRDFYKIIPRSRDYVRIGNLRQHESLAALKVLGVNPDQVYFLSYPDRGTPYLWNDHWSASNPYRSPFSGDSKSPYQLTYDPNSVYAGENYLADLTSIIKQYQPDLIVYPNPDDVHPDHWGLNVFTRLALTRLHHDDPAYQPAEYTYLVHRPDFPIVRGYKPNQGLVPPPALYAVEPLWYRWDLSPADVSLKDRAVMQYHSQLLTIRVLLESFVRTNELFAPVADASLPTVVGGNPLDPATWMDASSRQITAVQMDPVHDTFVRNALPGSDLVALYAARDAADTLWVCSQSDGTASEDITYELHLKVLTASGVLDYGARSANPMAGWHKAVLFGKYVCDQVNLAALGHPYAVFAGASSEGPSKILLDQVAWQMILIQP